MKKLKQFMQENKRIRSLFSAKIFWSLALLILPLIMLFIGCEGDNITVTPSGTVEGIQVTGSGSAFGEPDIAVLSLGVSTERNSVKEARAEAADAMQKVLDSIKNNGVAEEDIQTQQFSIQPQYDYINGERVLRGYRVTNMVSAKIRNLEQVGEIIDGAAEAGKDIVQVHSIRFTIDDPKELQAQARVEAMKDAEAKAETLATESGVKLGKPVSISESVGAYEPKYRLDEAATAEGASTPIETGELEIEVTVMVVYEIE